MQLASGVGQGSLDLHRPGRQVNVIPRQRKCLLAPQGQTEREVRGRVPRVGALTLGEDQAPEGRRDDREVTRRSRGPLHERGSRGVAADQSLRLSLGERLRDEPRHVGAGLRRQARAQLVSQPFQVRGT